MPKKLNFLGGMQNYNPKTGEYESRLVKGNGEPATKANMPNKGDKSFKAFSKDDTKAAEHNDKTFKSFSNKEKREEEIFDKWAEKLIDKERKGNPPEEVKIKVKDTPIERVGRIQIENALKEFKPESVNSATKLLQKYETIVDDIANDLESISNNTNGLMIGMEYRLKRLESLSRKLESYVAEEHAKGNTNFTIEDAAKETKDVARFTMVFNEDEFENSINKTVYDLEKNGYKLVRAKNTFKDGAVYKGLNCNFLDKDGNVFELQFHVPSSIKVKEGIEVDMDNKKAVSNRKNITAHDIYEETRAIDKKINEGVATDEEKELHRVLTQKSVNQWKDVPNYSIEL